SAMVLEGRFLLSFQMGRVSDGARAVAPTTGIFDRGCPGKGFSGLWSPLREEASVAARMEEQGPARTHRQGDDLAYVDVVVAGDMGRLQAAFDVGERTWHEQGAARASQEPDSREFRRPVGGEALRQLLLAFGQHAYPEEARGVEARV